MKHGSNITISALQRGSYTIAEPGLAGFDMTAIVGGYTYTITDNATTFVLNADNTADITNKPSTVPVKILKVDQARQPLEGAKFSLTGNGINLTGLTSANRTIKVIHHEEEVDVMEALIYESEALPIGKYTLTETGTPAGYYSVEDVTIDVQNTETGIVVTARIGDEEIEYPKIEQDRETGVWKIEITNQSGVELPHTGGPGTTLIYLFGIVLTGIAGAGLVVRKRRRDAA